ncbi:MAG: hypothetical protein ACODAU_09575 [Myxococcota bacterium]
MRRGPSWELLALPLAVALAPGCGDGGGAMPPPGFDGGPRDTGGGDAASTSDAGDAGGGQDAGPPTCAFDPDGDLVELGTDVAGLERRVALAPGSDGVLAVWVQNDGSSADVFSRFVPPSGEPPEVEAVADDDSLARDPAVARVGTGFVAAWVDNSEGTFEVMARPLDPAGSPDGAVVPVTDNALREAAVALTGFDDGALVAWIEEDTSSGERTLRLQRLDASGSPTGTASPVRTGAALSQPALTAATDAGVLAWVEGDRVAVQALDEDGAPSGDVDFADAQMNASGTVDVAFASEGMETAGGAVVHGVRVSTRNEARWRRLDAAAAVTGSERPLTEGSVSAADPSVAPFRGGFVATYRVLSDPSADPPLLRLGLLDNAGDAVDRLDLVDAAEEGGRTTVEVGLDGHVVVGWSDTGAGTTTLRAARIRCGS